MCQSSPSPFFYFFLAYDSDSNKSNPCWSTYIQFSFLYIIDILVYIYYIQFLWWCNILKETPLWEEKKVYLFLVLNKKTPLGKKILKTTHYLEKKVYYSNIICDTSYSCDSLHIFIFKKRFPLRKNFIIKFLSLINLISKLLMSFCLEKSRFCHANSIHIFFLQDL